MSRFRRNASQKKPKRLHKINEHIRFKNVRVINENGSNLGVMNINAALQEARSSGLETMKEEVKDFGVVLSDIKVEATQATLMFNPGKV